MREYDHHLDNYPHLFLNGFGFGFFKMSNPINPQKEDKLIFATIGQIIFDFMSQQGADVVLLYHCDFKDGRQAVRDRLFQSMLETSTYRDYFKKDRFEANIKETNVTHYMGYITPVENPNLSTVQLEFDACAFNLMQEKITE